MDTPIAFATPLQAHLLAERKARLARFAQAAGAARPSRKVLMVPFRLSAQATAALRAPLSDPGDLQLAAAAAENVSGWRTILMEFAAARGVALDDILGRNGTSKIAAARHEAVFVLWAMTDLSFLNLAHRMGGRHHTTIFNSLRREIARRGLPFDGNFEATRPLARAEVDLAEFSRRLRGEG